MCKIITAILAVYGFVNLIQTGTKKNIIDMMKVEPLMPLFALGFIGIVLIIALLVPAKAKPKEKEKPA